MDANDITDDYRWAAEAVDALLREVLERIANGEPL